MGRMCGHKTDNQGSRGPPLGGVFPSARYARLRSTTRQGATPRRETAQMRNQTWKRTYKGKASLRATPWVPSPFPSHFLAWRGEYASICHPKPPGGGGTKIAPGWCDSESTHPGFTALRYSLSRIE